MSKQTNQQQSGWTITGMIKITHWSPRWLIRSLSLFTAKLNYWLNWRTTKVMRKNLSICYPEASKVEIDHKILKAVEHNASLTKEFATAWLGSRHVIEKSFKHVSGAHLIDEIKANQKPLIMAVPHIGNWEFFWHWLQFNYQIIGMYQPAKYHGVESLVLDARQRFGGQVFATDTKGIMRLFRALKQGKILMILPDQAPRKGAGIYTPFFSHPAYTMTLLHKMVEKTGAELLFGCCVRSPDKSSFSIHIEQPTFKVHQQTVETFNRGMNRQIESMINRWPNQYQWTYKRFKRQPEGDNPYSDMD